MEWPSWGFSRPGLASSVAGLAPGDRLSSHLPVAEDAMLASFHAFPLSFSVFLFTVIKHMT